MGDEAVDHKMELFLSLWNRPEEVYKKVETDEF